MGILLPALMVQDPWITLIERGEKDIELRTWLWKHRGDLVLAASKGRVERELHLDVNGERQVTRCIVDLHDMREATLADAERAGFTPARMREYLAAQRAVGKTVYAWMLRSVRSIPRIRVEGKLGPFKVALPEGEAQVRAGASAPTRGPLVLTAPEARQMSLFDLGSSEPPPAPKRTKARPPRQRRLF